MCKLDCCIGTHNTEDVNGDNITRVHVNLYLVNNRCYEVDYECMSMK